MAGFARKRWARAAVCAAALLTPLAVSGCRSGGGAPHIGAVGDGGGTTASTSAAVSAPASPSEASSTPSQTVSSSAAPDPTAGTRLTISDGTSKVEIDGKPVDFGTPVHDLAWSPDGSKAAFIDGTGSLSVANADGSGRVEVAKNPGGQKWSHPAWQVFTPNGQPPQPLAKDNIFFGSSAGGVATLEVVSATAHDGKPAKAQLNGQAGKGQTPPPATGNGWPSAAGKFGSAVYEHDQGSTTDVYIRDEFLRQTGAIAIKDASEPAFYVFPTGGLQNGARPEVAFVRSVNGHKHVFVAGILTAVGQSQDPAKDLTPSATVDCIEPVWSPDGKTIAFVTPNGIETVGADGSGKPTQVTTISGGVPAYRPGP